MTSVFVYVWHNNRIHGPFFHEPKEIGCSSILPLSCSKHVKFDLYSPLFFQDYHANTQPLQSKDPSCGSLGVQEIIFWSTIKKFITKQPYPITFEGRAPPRLARCDWKPSNSKGTNNFVRARRSPTTWISIMSEATFVVVSHYGIYQLLSVGPLWALSFLDLAAKIFMILEPS